jgi:hypothetical protein
MWCIEGLIVTHSNLKVNSRIRAPDEHCFLISLSLGLVFLRIVVLVTLAIEVVSICAKNKIKWHN